MAERMEFPDPSQMLSAFGVRGPVADPATFWLLDKSRVARLKIRQLDMTIAELEKQIEFLKLQQDMLKEEYRIT
jgi:hypothetical protein